MIFRMCRCEVEPCGDGCPDLEGGDCRPSGDLYFILEKFPMFGAICRLHTSSYRSVRNLSNGLMQIRRLNGGRLTGIKPTLKATPERISYSDRDGTRHTSVAYILSLEIGAANLRALVANMTEPVRLLGEGRAALDLSRGIQYVVRETDAERAEQIAGEFYPKVEAAPEGSAGLNTGESEKEEPLARICELARQLGYNDAKTKMLIGQSAGDLASLERKLLNELDDQPGRKSAGSSDNGHGGQPKKETSQSNRTATSNPRDAARTDGSAPPAGGFLF